MIEDKTFGFATRAVHAGATPNPITGAIAPDISVSANYACRWGELGFSAEGTDESSIEFAYQREAHPNGRQLERRLASLEGGEDALVFASGIAAISGLLLHLLSPGDHLLLSDVSYAGSAEFARGFLRDKGIEVTVADMSNVAEVSLGIRPNTRVIYIESPCNPNLKLVDIEAISRLARGASAWLVVDSTFATPVVTHPLLLGADYVVHSLTKYLGGHGDALGGAVIGKAAAIRDLRHIIGTHLGATLSPFSAWLIMRGIETLPIRMEAYARSALMVAQFLESHPFVIAVRYPGLESHPQYALAQRQMRSGSGMIAFTVKDNEAFGRSFEKHLKIFKFAASLGHSHSLILYCNTLDLQKTTFQLNEDLLSRYRAFAGDGLFRLSIGLETVEDLIEDLRRALDVASGI